MVQLGTAMRPGELLALRPRDITDGPSGMVAYVNGTVVQRKGSGAVRQDHPKTDASIRCIPVPEFSKGVLRRRLALLGPEQRDRTIFASRNIGPLSPYNVRRTFRDFVKLAGLAETGITLRWYRRTGATVIARGMGTDAAATFLGHTSSAITEVTTSSLIGPSIALRRLISTAPCDRSAPMAPFLPCLRSPARSRSCPRSMIRTVTRSPDVLTTGMR